MKNDDKKTYKQKEGLREDNKETSEELENQNKNHNIKKEALGPNTRR